jgi:hypothetical protein
MERSGLDAFTEADVSETSAQFSSCFASKREGKGVAGVGSICGDSIGNSSCEDTGFP